MSANLPTPEGRTPDTSPATHPPSQYSKPRRVLACVLCQQRKVKCDRRFPCANCLKSGATCIPGTQVTRRRKRRFPERELLERLRKYEGLLRQNDIKFDPLHKDAIVEKDSPHGDYDSDDDHLKMTETEGSTPSTTVSSDRVYAYSTKNIWHAMNHEFRDPGDSDSSGDDVRKVVIKKAWNQLFAENDHLLFGSRKTPVDLSTLHPEPVQLFRLWQIYLDNVDSLLKVTHTPTLQSRIIEAAGNISKINPIMEALMFSIYCVAVLSLEEDDCPKIFGSSRTDLLTKYQFACQQALLNCSFLRCDDRDCLTALYLYLVSVRSITVPQSISSMLGIAVRIAQRMGMNNESALAQCTPFEAEMRRRLWWSLTIFDTRVCELADFNTANLHTTVDCRIPLNVNDSELRPEMKDPPQTQERPTEALFAAIRSDISLFVQKSHLLLNYKFPVLTSTSTDRMQSEAYENFELAKMENMIEEKYLRFCDPENRLHFMTLWTTRSYIARCYLYEHLCKSRHSNPTEQEMEAKSDAVISYALTMLDCDTRLVKSPLTKGFHWQLHLYFPFMAYILLVQHLKWRPTCDQADLAWETMSNNYEVGISNLHRYDNPLFKIFARLILHTWEVRAKASQEMLVPPTIVVDMRQRMSREKKPYSQTQDATHIINPPDQTLGGFPPPAPTELGVPSMLYGMAGPGGWDLPGMWDYPSIPGMNPLDVDLNQLDLTSMDWDLVNASTSETGDSAGLSMPY